MVAVFFSNTAALEVTGPFTASYLTDQATVWEKLTAIFVYSTALTYCKVVKMQRNVRKGYLALHDHYLRPNNVDHMAYEQNKSIVYRTRVLYD